MHTNLIKLNDMELSDEEKAKINYRIQKEREAKDENLGEWVAAFIRVIIFFGVVLLFMWATS